MKLNTKLSAMIMGTLIFCSFISANAMSKFDRALVIVTDLDTHGAEDMRDLYGALEDFAVTLPTLPVISQNYGQIVVLRNRQATPDNYISELKNLGSQSRIKAIDSFIMLHGSPDTLWFTDGPITDGALKNKFLTPVGRNAQARNLDQQVINKTKGKLRLAYNTSCFGKTHFFGLEKMGFKVRVGSKKVNANGHIEFPSFLALWELGNSVEVALAPTNNDFAIFTNDEPLRILGRNQNSSMLMQINSKKLIGGNPRITINSMP